MECNNRGAFPEKMSEMQKEMEHLICALPGGVVRYRVEEGRFIPTYFSDGVAALLGYRRDEFEELIRCRVRDFFYEADLGRIREASANALRDGETLDISCRMRHRDGNFVWVHLNGRFLDVEPRGSRFYVVFTGMSEESRIFQSIADESADGIYVIGRENYELLYFNENKTLFASGVIKPGQTCYAALHGREKPCDDCFLKAGENGTSEGEMRVAENDKVCAYRCREFDWNGVPGYLVKIQDITAEVSMRREKERLEQYFQTLVKNLPGGIAVMCHGADGSVKPEYLSDGFAAMTGVTLEEAWELYRMDALAGVHPDDRTDVLEQMNACIAGNEKQNEMVYRLYRGGGGYIWVKTTLSIFPDGNGGTRVYGVYHDCTDEIEKQEQLRKKYNELLVQHYRMPGPNALLVGHCNITRGRIQEINDYTDSGLLEIFGANRENFFTGLSGLIQGEKQRRKFLDTYLDAAALAAYNRGEREKVQVCYMNLPREPRGRYVQIKMNMVKTPDTGDITGILTVQDITEDVIAERITKLLSVNRYDFVADVDFERNSYRVLTLSGENANQQISSRTYTEWIEEICGESVVLRDREQLREALCVQTISTNLRSQESYTVSYSVADGSGDIRTKNLTVSAVDAEIGRACITIIDITESLREQQGLLNMIAYTFDQANLVQVKSKKLCMYTRKTVLEKLSPYIIDDYDRAIEHFTSVYVQEEEREWLREQLKLEHIVEKLKERPSGYDFVFSYCTKDEVRYKQVNVLWGDENHSTVCIVRADVTEMLRAERQGKERLQEALNLAKEANRAKSDFLSAMSHDIRTPMNAVIGMNALALAHLDNKEKVRDCLQKISLSSRHLLSLINDVLDMSKIECSKITLHHMQIYLPELLRQISAILEPQARAAGLTYHVCQEHISHNYFYGDALRINQILINLISNAIKFTPEGGTVEFLTEERLPAERDGYVSYRFAVRDTGVGMTEDFLADIFEPFARSRGVEFVEGTGLGLSITKGLVELMEGSITVNSKVGEGTVFEVLLEFEMAREDGPRGKRLAETVQTKEQDLFAGRRFLIAEDNAINAEILCELLGLFGAETEVKKDGAQAVSAFEENEAGTYDAILMDIQMPRMNGYEASRVIRLMDRPDAGTIPIIAMTANAFAEDIQASMDAGMTAHVAKPIDIHILKTTLFHVLNDKTQQSL